ncbi:MAG: glycosidase [Ignavibacteria bacterium]
MIPRVERLHNGMPLIARAVAHPWENKVTFNPACMLVEGHDALAPIIAALPFSPGVKVRLEQESALCFLLYRAQGAYTRERDYRRSSMGLAVLTPELDLLVRHTAPVFEPEYDYESLGVEDGRLSKVGDRYVLFYTAYGPGSPHNAIRIALASTQDFVHWEKHGLLKASFNTIDNKNAMLFEGTIDGKYLMLHRPMEGNDAMAMHWAEADDVFGEWHTRGVLMKAHMNPAFVDTWIGGGAPPLRLPDGRYLILYHIGNRKADGTREYDLGIAVADFTSPRIIVRRDEPLLRPEMMFETMGEAELGVNNVVFICGAYFYRGNLYFPYAGADSVVLAGRIASSELIEYLRNA